MKRYSLAADLQTCARHTERAEHEQVFGNIEYHGGQYAEPAGPGGRPAMVAESNCCEQVAPA